MLERGELVAECNIVEMPKVNVNSLTTLEKFKEDLKQGFGNNFGVFAFEEEAINTAGYTEYRVMIDGNVDEIPYRWVYYLLTDKFGNQAVVVFVIHAGKIELFGDSDARILDSFRMVNVAELPKL